MAKTISFRSFSSRGDLSLAANNAVAISPLSSCEIAIELPGFKLPKLKYYEESDCRGGGILHTLCYGHVKFVLNNPPWRSTGSTLVTNI
jgi:hypothetical protein